MEYLEKNKLILQEISSQTGSFTRGEVIGHSSAVTFTSIGDLNSDVLGRKIHLGIKESPLGVDVRTVEELAKISLIAAKRPSLVHALPEFYGSAVVNGNWAIITEDFSDGGTKKVENWDYFKDTIPHPIKDFDFLVRRGLISFGLVNTWLEYQKLLRELDPRSDLDTLASMCFIVSRCSLRLGDFDKYFQKNLENSLAEIGTSFSNIWNYTESNEIKLYLPYQTYQPLVNN